MYVKSFAGTARVYAVHTINIRHKLCATFALEFTSHEPHRHFNGVALVVAAARRDCLQQDYCIKRTNIHMFAPMHILHCAGMGILKCQQQQLLLQCALTVHMCACV